MYCRPAEWRNHKTIWLAWPYDRALWGDNLGPAQQEFLHLVKALYREQLVIIFPTKEEFDLTVIKFGEQAGIIYKIMPYGDIWLRDTLPIFVKDDCGETTAIIPQFNGWGGKYLFADDLDLAVMVADSLKIPKVFSSLVFEGGAVECDGAGTILTTKQCLLNANRNLGLSKDVIEQELSHLFGAKKVIWLEHGLKNDHTDGHIDTIARFIAPHTIAVMTPSSTNDPNYEVMLAIRKQLAAETDADGYRFHLVEVPSPCAVTNRDGDIMPASYLNFIMGDHTLVVPLYGTIFDDDVVRVFKGVVDLEVIGLSAKAILTGGGAFHCISQEFYR